MENKIGLIPKIVVQGVMGPKEYGILLTDKRCIFVLEKASKATVLGVVGDAILTDKKIYDYENEKIDNLASDGKNIVVDYLSIKKLKIKRGLTGNILDITYTDNFSKKKTLKGNLIVPPELIKKKQREGLDKKIITEEYLKNSRKLFEKALPPIISQQAEWEI
ncbi:MAG: hypothetical protein OEV21_07360 [Thermoplasmata archaeon]|nr:hypothetical protein [Thermoplasmata archaeon]